MVVICKGCQQEFASKNELFRHLNKTAKTCLPLDEYNAFIAHIRATKREKIAVLYGYLPSTDYQSLVVKDDAIGIGGGAHAAWLVTNVIDLVSRGDSSMKFQRYDSSIVSKIHRSYGHSSNESLASEQDEHTGAITEVLSTTAVPLFVDDVDDDDDEASINNDDTTEDTVMKRKLRTWVDSVNDQLDRMLSEMASDKSVEAIESNEWSPGRIRVFGRITITQKKFNAQTDVTNRRIDYCFPASLLFANDRERFASNLPDVSSLQEYCDGFKSFPPGNKPLLARTDSGYIRPSDEMLTYLLTMKKVMRRIATQVEELTDAGSKLEKEFNQSSKRKKKKKKQRKRDNKRTISRDDASSNKPSKVDKQPSTNTDSKPTSSPSSKTRLLKRKRFHNFTKRILAHNHLAYRRVDRIFHRASIRLQDEISTTTIKNRPFIVFSLTGDMFLHEQAVHIMGLLIAIFRGVIDEDIIDCMFDENFTSLVPAPSAPHFGLLQGEATYMTMEGKMQKILNARRCNKYNGFGNEDVVSSVEEWEVSLLQDVAKTWLREGEAADGTLNSETQWIDNVLMPWSKKTNELLKLWRASKTTDVTSFLPPLSSVDPSVPKLYEKVLFYLREADKSGRWPSTTPGRQLVMLSTSNEGHQANLSMASLSLSLDRRYSAYSFKEGEGGASGSFSVGLMPGEQPKANLLFPELVKAAFELEVALCPDRPPSSTIAINRNAAFRPHTDSGAGAGQSTSLIVGLGHYNGGELVVEGEKKDIRYSPIEFDGWKQRHWTLPFSGERYSLVWFTPKGCEGMRGIDLEL